MSSKKSRSSWERFADNDPLLFLTDYDPEEVNSLELGPDPKPKKKKSMFTKGRKFPNLVL